MGGLNMADADNNKVIFLFKTPYRNLYKQQNLTLLALPSGFSYSLEYEKKWVDPKLLNQDVILNQKGLIVLIEQKNTEPNGKGLIVPVRTCIIKSIRMRGPIFIVNFILGPFLILKNLKMNKSESLFYDEDEVQNYIIRELKSLKYPGHNIPGSFVQVDDFPEGFDITKESEQWYKIVRFLSSLPKYDNSVFCRLKIGDYLGIDSGFDSTEEVEKIVNFESANGSVQYDIKSGQKVAIHCSFYNPHFETDLENDASKKLILYSEEEICSLPEDKVSIPVTKYEEKIIPLFCKNAGTTGIFIHGNREDEYDFPHYIFLINVHREKQREKYHFSYDTLNYHMASSELLFKLETSLRNFIHKNANILKGKDWMEKVLSEKKLFDIKRRKKSEEEYKWLYNKGLPLLYFSNFHDLKDILINIFSSKLRRIGELKVKMQEIEAIRNAIAHNRPIHEEIYHRLKLYCKDIEEMIKDLIQ